MYVKDLSDNEYIVQCSSISERELNGNQTLSAIITPTASNRYFIDNIAEMWSIYDFDNVEHKIVYVKRRGEGDKLVVEIKAVPRFLDDFDTLRIYEEYNEHMTAHLCFSRIFSDTKFNFVLVDDFTAIEWQGLGGGETRLEMFKRALERYRAEFRIVGNTVYLEKLIGNDTNFQYRYRLNANNITQETDASAMYTYVRGYGDYGDGEGGEDWKDAKLIREYRSPLADVPGIGERHAPPIKDGRIKDINTMDAELKSIVDNSIKISVSADIASLRRQGYEGIPELGDRVFVIDERIGLDADVRVVQSVITRDWRGNIIDTKLTFGTEQLSRRYQSNLTSQISEVKRGLANTDRQVRTVARKVDEGRGELEAHLTDNVRHITQNERDNWNNKASDGDITTAISEAVSQANAYTDGKLVGVNSRLSEVESEVSALDARVSNIEAEIDDIKQRLDAL